MLRFAQQFRPIVEQVVKETASNAMESAASTAVGLSLFSLFTFTRRSPSPTLQQPVAKKVALQDPPPEMTLSK